MEVGTSTVGPSPSTSNGDDRKKRLSSAASSSSSSSDTSFIDLQVDDKVRHVSFVAEADEQQSSDKPSSAPTVPGGARAGDIEITPYRLPSSVLSRVKSGSPNDWSLTSNESLFSIYMGNTSFNRDFAKDGESILAAASSMKDSTNPPLTPPLEHPIAADNATESGKAKVEDTDQAADLTVNADHKTTPSVSDGAPIGSPSRISNSSAVSFAFPILMDKQKSVSGVKKVKTSGAMAEQRPQSEEELTVESPKPPQVPPKAARRRGTKLKWLSCFSCWSSRPNGV